MSFRSLLTLIVLLAVMPVTAYAQRMDELISGLVGYKEVPGAALLIENGQGVQAYYAGVGDIHSPEWLINESSRFHIGSVTKLYTSVMLMNLVAAGHVGLDEFVKDHVYADFDGSEIDNFEYVTFRHVLESSTGLADLHGSNLIQDTYLHNKCLKHENDAARYVYGLPAKHKAGQGIGYSSLGYVILGSVLKAKYDVVDLEEVYQKNLLNLFGLRETSFNRNDKTVYGVERYNINFPMTSTKEWAGCMRLADGGLMASGQDVLKFISTLFRDVEYTSSDMMRYMLDTPAGFSVWKSEYGLAYGHKGRFPGYVSAAYHFPARDTSLVLLVNSGLVHIEKVLEEIAYILFADDERLVNTKQFVWGSYQDEVADKDLPLPEIGVPAPF